MKPAAVRQIGSVSELGHARILCIGTQDVRTLRHTPETLGTRGVLRVTDHPGALDEGSVITFIPLERHVRFEISTAAERRSGLTLSSELASVATRVMRDPPGSLSDCPPGRMTGALDGSCTPRLASR